ncbi:putative orphan protein [Pseudoalteromonas luteoviolacea B = ATCC 29581]|nr:putative orphan protein [Pseudoalteromonas luteoviolacea B = ATCC 29581]
MHKQALTFLSQLKTISPADLNPSFSSLENEARQHVLHWLYQQSQDPERYGDMQSLACLLLTKQTLPQGFMSSILTQDMFSFFFEVLCKNQLLTLQNPQGNTVLHLMFADKRNDCPAFNFIRSLMLFERNEVLANALVIKNHQHLTPFETYLAHHPFLGTLPVVEVGAALALIESQKQFGFVAHEKNLTIILQHLAKIHGVKALSSSKERLVLLSVFYELPTQFLLKRISIC